MHSLLEPQLIRQSYWLRAAAGRISCSLLAARRALGTAHAYVRARNSIIALPSLTNQKCRRLATGLWRTARSKTPTAYRPALQPAAAANIKAGAYLPVSNLAWGDDKRAAAIVAAWRRYRCSSSHIAALLARPTDRQTGLASLLWRESTFCAAIQQLIPTADSSMPSPGSVKTDKFYANIAWAYTYIIKQCVVGEHKPARCLFWRHEWNTGKLTWKSAEIFIRQGPWPNFTKIQSSTSTVALLRGAGTGAVRCRR